MPLPIVPLLTTVGGLLKDALPMLADDKKQQAEIAIKQLELQAENEQGQLAVNVEEAKNPSLFVSGWRPAIGWVGAFALAYTYIIQPVIISVSEAFGNPIRPMTLDYELLEWLILGLLGLGGFRTYEKKKGLTAGR